MLIVDRSGDVFWNPKVLIHEKYVQISPDCLIDLPDGFGIRTTSTSQADDVLPNTWAGQTSQMSGEVYGLVNDVIFVNDFE